MSTINALTAINPVGTATSDSSSSRQQSQQQAKPGQTFSATVLESAGNNKVYLDIFGDKILASSDKVTLSPGTRLNLEILSTKPLLELKIISRTPELFFGKTLTLLGKNLDISALFQSLNSLASPLPGKLSQASQAGIHSFYNLQQTHIGNKDGGALLKQLIDRLGLAPETVPAKDKGNAVGQTLKAALLEITSIVREGGAIADGANRLLGTLDVYQLAQLRLATENIFLFPLPLPFLANGYLLVEQDTESDKGLSESDTLRFSLHLTLEPLGNIEITFLQTKDGLYIRFSCESTDKKEFTSDFQNDLKEMISSTEVLGLSFTDTAGDAAGDLIQQLVPNGKTILDTKI
ncbi:hypothetical protein JYT85_00420 [Desulfocapsa sp. AH-315-G09]|nr:hypothetical protein [Desulfocapsa sp.]MBN4065095.1 hypothetical protein [Desulfocapsa sp. AH-315-G09]